MHLRNEDLSDREMLHLINDVAQRNERGLVLADDIAEALEFNNGDGSGSRAVATRMAWMKRLGYVDRIEARQLGLPASDSPRYVITREGRAIMGGRLNKAVQKTLDGADAGTGVLLMRELAERSYVRGSDTQANATRRQWLHSSSRRSRGR